MQGCSNGRWRGGHFTHLWCRAFQKEPDLILLDHGYFPHNILMTSITYVFGNGLYKTNNKCRKGREQHVEYHSNTAVKNT